MVSMNNENSFKGVCIKSKININHASLNEIMRLKDIDEEIAHEIIDFAKDTTITDNFDLLELESIDVSMLNSWKNFISDMRININRVDKDILLKVKGIDKNLAEKIVAKRNELGSYTHINQLKQIETLKKEAFDNIKLRFKI